MNLLKRGVFITFEGPDGSGKTTNIKYLKTLLEERGYRVVTTREPGGTPLAEDIRSILLHRKMALQTECMLFFAARAEHLDEVIIPSVNRGEVVLCDRFADSTYAYQVYGRGYSAYAFQQLEELVVQGNGPDYTLFFDVPLETSQERLAIRSEKSDRFDQEVLAFKERVWHGYHQRLKEHGHRMHHIDANQPLEHVQQQLKSWVDSFFVARYPLPASPEAQDEGSHPA